MTLKWHDQFKSKRALNDKKCVFITITCFEVRILKLAEVCGRRNQLKKEILETNTEIKVVSDFASFAKRGLKPTVHSGYWH